MSAKTQHNNILLAIIGFAAVVVIVAIIGFFAFDKSDEIIQGEVEVSEYRVSSKLPGRILELRVKEGDFVKAGDTLAILEVPEVDAQKRAAEATQGAAQALSDMAGNGARKEQVQAAYDTGSKRDCRKVIQQSAETVRRGSAVGAKARRGFRCLQSY